MQKKRTAILAALTAAVVISAILIATTALRTTEPPAQRTFGGQPAPPRISVTTESFDGLLDEDIDSQLLPLALEEVGATNKEGLVSFTDEASYQNFLASLSSKGLRLISSSDQLLTARVAFRNFSQLEDIEGAEISPNYPVAIPTPPAVSAQANAIGFQGSALRSIGIHSDNSQWGAGITVAVIDSGVNDHIALKDGVTRIELTQLSDGSAQLGHGTAVASIISGNHSSTPGVAPASDILSIRVTDESGRSNSYTLAEGIIAAVEGGAEIINISMGSQSDSAVLAKAVRYAQDRGAIIVASSGNEGADSLSYPATYPGVLSVGAIEANGEHLDFSNQGENLSLTAPGFEVNAAWGENLLTGFSGTSASAPFVSGALAAILSENPSFNTQQASDLLLGSVSEGGMPGADPQYGAGTLDVGRAIENGTAGIYDIAVTGQILQTRSNGSQSLLVVVQNQGTEPLFNSPVSVSTPQGTTQISINSLAPGSVHTSTIPLHSANLDKNFSVLSSAGTSNVEDIDPQNNTRQTHFGNSAE